MKRLLIFGASITQGFHDVEGGWADRLKRDLLRRNTHFSIFNLGISGDRVGDILKRFGNETDARTKRGDNFEETVILFFAGTNNTYKEGKNNGPNTSKNQFAQEFTELLQQAKSKAKCVLACSITSVDETRTTPVSWRDIYYTNAVIDAYNEVIEQLCQEQGVKFIDLRKAIKKVNWNELLDDGLHPNTEGHKFLFEQIQPHLIEILENEHFQTG